MNYLEVLTAIFATFFFGIIFSLTGKKLIYSKNYYTPLHLLKKCIIINIKYINEVNNNEIWNYVRTFFRIC